MPAIDRLFDELLARGGSDLHLGVDYPPLARVRGELTALGATPLTTTSIDDLMSPLLTPAQRERFDEDKDLHFAVAHGTTARFRANYFFKTTGKAAVFRAIPSKIPTLSDLGGSDAVKKLCDRKSGLVVVSGPAGSGRSTTLAAMVRHINDSLACQILTIEDPIEFVHAPQRAQVTHREVGPHASSFAAAIRSAAREDPDVVLVGELADAETMKLALELASIGVLVLSSVNTSSAAGTVDRIVTAFPESEQPQIKALLGDVLAGVIGQQLLKTADGKNRVCAQEILIGTPSVATILREGKTFQLASAMQSGHAAGMQTNDIALERLLSQKKITYESALERYSDRENAEKKLKALAAV
jgi:twitching motility protein PilT